MSKNNNEKVEKTEASLDFVRQRVDDDVKAGKNDSKVMTRFPPEPNGFLHIGHAKSICLNFGIAEEFSGVYNLRFDDTNPVKEDNTYVESIQKDIRWLGFDWEDRLYYASNYFEKLYGYAIELIKIGKAYVCSLTPEQMRETRGTLTEPGQDSPYRTRSVEENLELFEQMRAGKFDDGAHVLRAKIDMASPNLNMRDPIIYRIRKVEHHRTGDKWCIYPMYDFTHCLSDSIEGITHSICTLEFENHRPLYDWFLDELKVKCHPPQIEFAKLNLNYAIMGKRKLLRLVQEKFVCGWDDPRMLTLAGMRRRGYTPKSIRKFCEKTGVSKFKSVSEMSLLEYCIREDLNEDALRVMSVLRPLKVVIENYPENQSEELEAPNHPTDESLGKRKVPFSKVLYIEQDDFMEEPPKKFFRLAPGREVRLRYAFFIKCTDVVKDEKTGEIKELRCTYDPETRGGSAPDGRKVKATLHWLSAKDAVKAEVRLYDYLFSKPDPNEAEEGKDFTDNLNPNSLEVVEGFVEPGLKKAKPGNRYQFERLGYFCVDQDSTSKKLVFNRTVTLKDVWAKVQKKEQKKGSKQKKKKDKKKNKEKK